MKIMTNWETTFNKTDVDSLNVNVFNLIGKDWFLVTAGSSGEFNMMTASWGTMGVFWHKPVLICFIRPTRHTFNFMEESDLFSVSFLKDDNRSILNYCGSHSGRDGNKVEATGLLPVEMENGTISYEQSKLVLECKKIYFDDLKPVFFLPEEADEKFYPNKDYHRVYYGEIVAAYEPK